MIDCRFKRIGDVLGAAAILIAAFPFFIGITVVAAPALHTIRRDNHLTPSWVRALAHRTRYTSTRIQHALACQPINGWRDIAWYREQGQL